MEHQSIVTDIVNDYDSCQQGHQSLFSVLKWVNYSFDDYYVRMKGMA